MVVGGFLIHRAFHFPWLSDINSIVVGENESHGLLACLFATQPACPCPAHHLLTWHMVSIQHQKEQEGVCMCMFHVGIELMILPQSLMFWDCRHVLGKT